MVFAMFVRKNVHFFFFLMFSATPDQQNPMPQVYQGYHENVLKIMMTIRTIFEFEPKSAASVKKNALIEPKSGIPYTIYTSIVVCVFFFSSRNKGTMVMMMMMMMMMMVVMMELLTRDVYFGS